MQKILIWASGKGSNAKALIEASRSLSNVEIVGLVTDNIKAKARDVAQSLGVKSYLIDPRNTVEILQLLNQLKPDWSFLAGYMRILPEEILCYFRELDPSLYNLPSPYRVLNIHPSLLPKYPGLKALERSYESGEEELGVTVHFVDTGLDTGPILFQSSFTRHLHETLDEIKIRCHELEHKLYTQALKWVNDLEKAK